MNVRFSQWLPKQAELTKASLLRLTKKLHGSYLVKSLTKLPTTNVLRPESRAFVSDINLYNIQAKIIEELSNTQSCIIVGKCADYILRDKPNVLSVFVEAYTQDCINLIRSRVYVSEERAKDMKKRTDKYRTAYYKYYTRGQSWRDSLNYDMFLNTSRISKEKRADIIADAVKIKFGIK